MRQLAPVLARRVLPEAMDDQDRRIRSALDALHASPRDPLTEAIGGSAWLERVAGRQHRPIVPQVADFLGNLTARAVREAGLAATAPAGSPAASHARQERYDPDRHPYTGHGGRALRPGWQLSWTGKAHPETGAPDMERAIPGLAAVALGLVRWRAGVWRIRIEGMQGSLGAGQDLLTLPGLMQDQPERVARLHAAVVQELVAPMSPDIRRLRARRLARLLLDLRRSAPEPWAGGLWGLLHRHGWSATVLAEAEAGRLLCEACEHPRSGTSCPRCGPNPRPWWSVT